MMKLLAMPLSRDDSGSTGHRGQVGQIFWIGHVFIVHCLQPIHRIGVLILFIPVTEDYRLLILG